MMRVFPSWRQFFASTLIFVLLFSQTIRVDFLSEVNASEDRYRDIVSIFVDTDTYGSMRSKISRYAEDIQSYLGSTRVSIFVVDKNVSPAQIAAKNEKLYYEGDGEKGMVTHLVGTILIGDLPIPMVSSFDQSFASIYPYVDFVDKKFVYDNALKQYVSPISQSQNIIEPEIWHGVINPALGHTFTSSGDNSDIVKIGNFLDKTHDFYEGKGVFSPSDLPPRVFYFDGYAESKSITKKAVYQYVLNMQNSENIAYRRYNHYLLGDINAFLAEFDAQEQSEEFQMIASLGLPNSSDTLDQSTISSIPDIQTETAIKSFLKDFYEIINEKTLGDELLAVHNAGRYNSGSAVGADLAAMVITTMDDAARATLITANQAIMTSIDAYLTGADLVSKVPIFDTYEQKVPITISGSLAAEQQGAPYGYNTFHFQNYLFGKKAGEIISADQCTIARGGSEGSGSFVYPILTEANTMYSIATGLPTSDMLKQDTELLVGIHKDSDYACFDVTTGIPKTFSYWGDNALLALSTRTNGAETMFTTLPSGTAFTGMTESIYDLAGMKETTRLGPASIGNCVSPQYQYTIQVPEIVQYIGNDNRGDGWSGLCSKSSLDEWNVRTLGCELSVARDAPDPLRYSCLSKPQTLSYTGTFISDVARYNSPKCLSGNMSINGKPVYSVDKQCYVIAGGGDSAYEKDITAYESVGYQVVPGILRHISPTDEEIAAAKASGVTPSLAIDAVRYIEFVTPKGNIARINYPNFFNTPATDIPSFRNWLTSLSKSDWDAIIAQENTVSISPDFLLAKQFLGGNGTIPQSPVDWNAFISDTTIIKILQARNWLTPDISQKYVKGIEAALSYSRTLTGDILSPPGVPNIAERYEVAYLGLNAIVPESMNVTSDPNMEAYDTTLSEINALNISEEDRARIQDRIPSPSDQCGPPEGVDLFKWPQAIMCWIKSLTPMKIVGQACGANTFGNMTSKPMVVPSASSNEATLANLTNTYSGGKLTFHIDNTSILPDGQTSLTVRYEKDGKIFAFPRDTLASLVFISGTDGQGGVVTANSLDGILNITPNPTYIGDEGARFLLSAKGKLGNINLKGEIVVVAKDGGKLTLDTDTINIKISDEYLEVHPTISGQETYTISATEASPLILGFSVRNSRNEILAPQYPISMKIYDDVTGVLVAEDVVISSDNYTLPSIYTQQPGVLRLVFRDKVGRTAVQSLAITGGALSQLQIVPVSSVMVVGSDVPTYLHLLDTQGNPSAPDVHGIDLTAQGGYFITEDGQKHATLHIDTIESEIPFTIGSDTVGTITINAISDNSIQASTTISAIESATLSIDPEAIPEVGGDPVSATIKVTDKNGNILSGFNSFASITSMEGAGIFTPSIVAIRGGVSDPIEYSPGQIAGQQQVQVSVPGISLAQSLDFPIKPGVPMYITHHIQGNSIIFNVRDRYGNTVPANFTGTILRSRSGALNEIAFTSGEFTLPRSTGYYHIEIPSLAGNTISYDDASGTHTINALSFYSVWISGEKPKFDFAPDYNARYTVLAGDSFLDEGSDILYNTTPGSGQSLAVTTLLESPYIQSPFFEILPGGNIRTISSSDALPELSLSLESGYPKVTIRDAVSQMLLAHIRYRSGNATLRTCEDFCTGDTSSSESRIDLISTDPGVTTKIIGNTLNLLSGNDNLLSISREGAISLRPGVTISLDANTTPSEGLHISIQTVDRTIAQIVYQVNPQNSIRLGKESVPGIVVLDSLSDISVEPIYASVFGSSAQGYRGFKTQDEKIISSEKNGPESIESLGALSESTAVGWGGSNRMMLSYAGGDTVGEATKWFHTYTMINLGDPVTHNDKHAPGTELEGMDRSIGTELTSPQASSILGYATRDMNKDGLSDIVVQHSDGYIELILNLRDRMKSRGNIAYIPSIISRGFSLGDFTDDGYADIVGADSHGNIVLLSNNERQFFQQKITLSSGELPPTSISQFKIYDMDADNKDDIVYLTENGELGILYGTENAGVFEKKILDTTLGITIDSIPTNAGGAFYDAGLPQYSLASSTSSTGLDSTRILNEVYTSILLPNQGIADATLDTGNADEALYIDNTFNSTLGDIPNSTVAGSARNFIRSQYAEAEGITIKKTITPISSSSLVSGDMVRIAINISNNTNRILKEGVYLDTTPAIFSLHNTESYQLTLGGKSVTRDFLTFPSEDFDAYFSLLDIPVGETLTISYDATVTPMSYGELLVGDYEKGETGADQYGDVGFQTSTTCGADMILWRSTSLRSYERGVRTFLQPELPDNIQSQLIDADNNGTPDSMENMTNTGQQSILNTTLRDNSATSDLSRSRLQVNFDANNQILDIGLDDQTTADVASRMQEIANGLSCGFGGGACMNFPMNWAPLAPGSAPVAFGYPLSSLTPSTGTPVFSALTGIPIYGPWGCFVMPTVYPMSPLGYTTACGAGTLSAGGRLGTTDPTNVVRIYATPTLTLGTGVAFCFGGPAGQQGNIPPAGTWPLMQGGNCVVVANPVNMCKGDGSIDDGDVRGISGLGSVRDSWNAASCSIQAGSTVSTEATEMELQRDIISYMKNPDANKLGDLYQRMSNRTASSQSAGPLLRIGGASTSGALSAIDVTIDTAKPISTDSVIKIKNKRIAGYPDFIMEWMGRQIDQITNALLSPPNLVIIPPTSVGQNAQYDGTLSGLTSTFSNAYSQKTLDDIKQKSGAAYDTVVSNQQTSQSLINRTQSSTNATSTLGKWMQGQQASLEASQDAVFSGALGKLANEGKGGISAIRAAYKLIGKLPLISISEKTVAINVPWILPQELDQYARKLDAYSREFQSFEKSFCANDNSPECLEQKAKLQTSGFLNSLNTNLKRIEEYKNFPIKLQKYITWKQRYLSQILCYVTEVQQMTTGWVEDNSLRFRKWAELIVLLKAVAKSWQPLLDIVAQKDAQCAVCHNERYNTKYWKYKIISALIPSIPVIQFPRWPDIVLDLHDIRFGIVLAIPNFQFNLNPIRLPSLPDLSLPNLPNVSVTLPNIPILPQIPELPDLPDLPTLPTIKLPNLPPPPKLPKLFASLQTVLKILKLFTLMECYVNKTTLVPEWTVGDVIAQRTERQGTLPGLDFIDLHLPQISIPSIREIRVASHVNFEMRSDFITQFAQAAVAPLNNFTADMGRGTPTQIGPDIQVTTPNTINIDLQSNLQFGTGTVDAWIADLEKDADVYLDQDDFLSFFRSVANDVPELSPIIKNIDTELAYARMDADKETKEILRENTQKFARITEYIEKQYAETAQLQNIVDLLQDRSGLLSEQDIRREMVSANTPSSSSLLVPEINNATNTIASSISPVEDPFLSEKKVLTDKFNRLAANDDFSSSNTVSSDVANGYTPNFQGIYVLTPSGKQTRLFDYIAPLTGKEVVTKIDIDQDGDDDYIFDLDGALFLKKSHQNDPLPQKDTNMTVSRLAGNDPLPTAPNFFHAGFSLPKALNFSYSAASSGETLWNTTFYDRYLEWDMIDMGIHNSSSTPKNIVELVQPSGGDQYSESINRSLGRVTDPAALLIKGPSVRILGEQTSFTLGAGRPIVTGNKNTTIVFTTPENTSYQSEILKAGSTYTFPTEREITIQKGKVYVFSQTSAEQTYTYSDDMIGMPIVPGMSIYTSGGSITLKDEKSGQDIVLDAGGKYRMERVTSSTGDYSTQFDYPNGTYTARIMNTNTHATTVAGDTLLVAQSSSDTSPPEWNLSDAIEVPVYQQKSYSLQDLITETSNYSLLVDPDTTQDTDGNGIYDDDFTSVGSGVNISNTHITFGPFDTLGNKNMVFQITDEFYNTILVNIRVNIYSPAPVIQSINEIGGILGKLDESLIDEPVHFFRVRPGADIRLIDTTPTYTTNGGIFSKTSPVLTGALFTTSGATIDLYENGLWKDLPNGYTSQIHLASTTAPLHIDIVNPMGARIYQTFLTLPDSDIFTDSSLRDGISLHTESGINAIPATTRDPNIPGGMYITDDSNHPLFALARDGNIYTVTSEEVSAQLSESESYPEIALFVLGKKVAQIQYRFDFFFTTK